MYGQAYIDGWLRRVDEAGRKVIDEEEEETKFVSGMTGERKWIRLTPTKELSLERLKALARESNLSCKVQDDDHLVVFGSDVVLKGFVKKIAAKHESKGGKEH
jgi:hypothetical protein